VVGEFETASADAISWTAGSHNGALMPGMELLLLRTRSDIGKMAHCNSYEHANGVERTAPEDLEGRHACCPITVHEFVFWIRKSCILLILDLQSDDGRIWEILKESGHVASSIIGQSSA
jgi:hypothetical protein